MTGISSSLQSGQQSFSCKGKNSLQLGDAATVSEKDKAAEAALSKALFLEPENFDFLLAMADYYLKKEQFSKAVSVAQKMILLFPNNKFDIVQYVKSLE